MKMLLETDHRRMPWKNRGGETLEVAVFPAGAGVDAFGWRVSMAVVAADGPFSAFPGIDRTIVLLNGNGMMLAVAGRAPITLTPKSDPYEFPADVATSATLTGGAITDLNVMTARGRFGHRVERFAGRRDVRAGADETLLLIGEGMVVESAEGYVTLGAREIVRLEAGEVAHASSAGLLVTISCP